MKWTIALFCALFLITPAVVAGPSLKPSYNNIKTVNRSFSPGEKLTYEISWSKIVKAGIAVMEVREGKTRDNRPAYDLVSSTHSTGIVDKFYPVRDTVQSLVDSEDFCSVSFSLRSSRGKRKRERDMLFDREKGTIRVTAKGETQVYPVPGTQLGLSARAPRGASSVDVCIWGHRTGQTGVVMDPLHASEPSGE